VRPWTCLKDLKKKVVNFSEKIRSFSPEMSVSIKSLQEGSCLPEHDPTCSHFIAGRVEISNMQFW